MGLDLDPKCLAAQMMCRKELIAAIKDSVKEAISQEGRVWEARLDALQREVENLRDEFRSERDEIHRRITDAGTKIAQTRGELRLNGAVHHRREDNGEVPVHAHKRADDRPGVWRVDAKTIAIFFFPLQFILLFAASAIGPKFGDILREVMSWIIHLFHGRGGNGMGGNGMPLP